MEITEKTYHPSLRDLEKIKLCDLRRNFGCSFRCDVGRIVDYVTGVTAENTAKKASKACKLIISNSLSDLARLRADLSGIDVHC